MTTEEEKNIIGGVVLEYAEVKQKIAALTQQLQNKLAVVHEFEKAMRQGETSKALPYLANWPPSEFFTSTLAAMQEYKDRKAALEQTMKQYGIDLP